MDYSAKHGIRSAHFFGHDWKSVGYNKVCRIFQFTIDSFKNPVSLSQIADIACMSIPAFCNYFKKSTRKTYIDFLNEVRIGYACTLLKETRKSVLEKCFDSGYNTMANFHKQFLKVKKLTPLQYRKYCTAKLALPQNNIGIVELI